MQDKPWRNEELREREEALLRLKEGDLKKTSRLYIPSQSSFGLDKKREEKL